MWIGLGKLTWRNSPRNGLEDQEDVWQEGLVLVVYFEHTITPTQRSKRQCSQDLALKSPNHSSTMLALVGANHEVFETIANKIGPCRLQEGSKDRVWKTINSKFSALGSGAQ